jgi:hypothetical protein
MTPCEAVGKPWGGLGMVANRVGAAAVLVAVAASGIMVASASGQATSAADFVWVEGEKPVSSTMHRHPWWYDKVRRDLLSGGDFVSNWSEKEPGEASYRAEVPKAGDYEFWVRANPLQSKLSYRINDGKWTTIDLTKDQQGNTNVAEDGKPDLRFVAWSRVGKVKLAKGANFVRFRMDSANNNHGYLDCFVLSASPFAPKGTMKPGQAGEYARRAAEQNQGWFAFAPAADRFSTSSGVDLRALNEKQAGDGGFIGVKDGRFVHMKSGAPVRFWAVNGPPGKDRDALAREAKILAKYGVNLVRIHHGYFEPNGAVKPEEVRHAMEIVEAMKAEGVYSHFSIYFPLWLSPAAGTPWLPGYDGKTHPFAALMFNPDFQAKYREWWRALLLTPSPTTGRKLIDEPAVAGVEVQNEDSYFFWTFDAKNIPDAELKIIEKQFGDWLTKRYGSLATASRRWNGVKADRDAPSEGRVGFRPLWNVFNEKTARDQDAVRFLAESQKAFYEDTIKFLRGLGFKGVVTASNWVTASPEVLGPLEKLSYTPGDFIDRHGYFGGRHEGSDAAWAIKESQTYADRSALRFEAEQPGKPKVFVHPAMEVKYAGKPSTISETTFNRPNRYRSEGPLFFAAYGALQGTDGIVHFAFDGSAWTVKPNYFMQPWSVMTPAMMGQFPAAALIYRKGLVSEGDVLASLNLTPEALFALQGTPLPQDASFDELRLKDVPKGLTLRPGNVIDPLIHLAGRTEVTFQTNGSAPVLKDLKRFVDRKQQTVAATNGQIRLDYGKGVLTINAPAAQGVSGDLRAAGTVDMADLSVSSKLDLGHIVAVSLDDRPLATSRKILLQVMTEEKPTDFRTEPAGDGLRRIVSIGRDPWLVKEFDGTVRFKRADASRLKVTALDENGEALKVIGTADAITLRPSTLYYRIAPE